jgi:hypothetical protein
MRKKAAQNVLLLVFKSMERRIENSGIFKVGGKSRPFFQKAKI